MKNLAEELNQVPRNEYFEYSLATLVDIWKSQGVGMNGVEAILLFIENNPTLNYGYPGALVHFSEEFYRRGYESALLRSFSRRPTPLTAWMLNRIINGTRDEDERNVYIEALKRGELNPATDEKTRNDILHFLEGFA